MKENRKRREKGYRLRMSEEEWKQVDRIREETGLLKSEIFRKAIERLYNQVAVKR